MARASADLYAGQRVKFFLSRCASAAMGTAKKVNHVNVDLVDTLGISWRAAPQLLKLVMT